MNKRKKSRGKCPKCGYRHPLILGGVLGRHSIYHGTEKRVCLGSYLLPVKGE